VTTAEGSAIKYKEGAGDADKGERSPLGKKRIFVFKKGFHKSGPASPKEKQRKKKKKKKRFGRSEPKIVNRSATKGGGKHDFSLRNFVQRENKKGRNKKGSGLIKTEAEIWKTQGKQKKGGTKHGTSVEERNKRKKRKTDCTCDQKQARAEKELCIICLLN